MKAEYMFKIYIHNKFPNNLYKFGINLEKINLNYILYEVHEIDIKWSKITYSPRQFEWVPGNPKEADTWQLAGGQNVMSSPCHLQ
jgi:hypothetical protein